MCLSIPNLTEEWLNPHSFLVMLSTGEGGGGGGGGVHGQFISALIYVQRSPKMFDQGFCFWLFC